MLKPPYDRRFFTVDDEGVGTSWDDFRTALHVWAWMRTTANQKPTVADAAVTFNVTNATIREAIGELHWVFLANGTVFEPHKQTIEFDGL